MTKERRIAIRMWEYIRDHFSLEHAEDDLLEDHVINLKQSYLYENGNIYWAYHCWFCHYIGLRDRAGRHYDLSRCPKCPLKSCKSGPYQELITANNEEEWVTACNKIIQALGGVI